ncbi:hypothetical protein [Enterobacter cloacae]|uniref:hypothetical protein n=1 Tax=Enterobacter cloacae TaxID=550 RepID=UPI0019D6F5EF|nr:hypothetical protein [Enterobacter cloacae]
MSTITKEFTKEQLQQIEAAAKEVMWPVVWSEKKAREHFSEKITPKVVLKLTRIALALLEAEAVCVIDQSNLDYLKSGSDADVWPASRTEMGDVLLYRAAPPAPVSVPDDVTAEDCPAFIKYDLTEVDEAWARGFNACRDAMLQGAENAESPTTMQTAPALDSSPKIAESTSGNSPVIPDGWVLVPIEPTYQMCEAMGLQWESPRFPDRYKAMLSAVKK